MNEHQLAITSGQEIPCMLLPMVDHNLLVPTTSIAEMSSVKPLDAIDNAPEWLMGMYNWRGLQVPVVSFEAINGGQTLLNPDGRIAVLNNTGVNQSLQFIAIHTQGIPRMARIADEDISEDEGTERRPFDLMAVKVGMEEFCIPDISAMEVAYTNLMDSSS
ncbi:MAG: chemotaxis protein CheW [Agarilytica sp.]